MPLDEQNHRSLVLWAANCAEHVLPRFEATCPQDERPRKAIEAARSWVRGEMPMTEARTAAFAAQAAARDADHAAAAAAARAAGHAAATVHVPGHARYAATYAASAAEAKNEEREWQRASIPRHLLPEVFSS
jgi:hypothetical protein